MNPNRSAILAKWRVTERALEVGLDPELVKRLDDLRVQDMQLMRGPSRRTADPGAHGGQPMPWRVSESPIPGSTRGFGGGAWWRR